MESVVIGYLDTGRTVGSPREANAILIVDSDAVLTLSLPPKAFQAIPRRKRQIGEARCGLKLIEFALRDPPDRLWATTSGGLRPTSMKYILSA